MKLQEKQGNPVNQQALLVLSPLLLKVERLSPPGSTVLAEFSCVDEKIWFVNATTHSSYLTNYST